MSQETFERELGRRAEAVHGAPLSFEDVRGRAVSIRRRRRATVTGAVAAAVALVVIVPTILTGGDSPGSDAPEPAPPPAAPGASVLHDGTLTKPEGETVSLDLDNEDVQQLGVLTDGRVVVTTNEPGVVQVYAADGTPETTYPSLMNTFTMSPTDDAVAWIAEDGTVRVLASGSPQPTELPEIPVPDDTGARIDAVLSPERLLVSDWNTTTGEVTPEGYRELATSEAFRVADVSPDGSLWAVSFPPGPNDQYGCGGLYDPSTDEVLARNCDVGTLSFAPDGQHLLEVRGDNNMFGAASVLDLDLQPVGTYESEGRGDVISRVAWADPTHLLVARTNWQEGTWELVRVGLGWDDEEVVVPEAPGGNPERLAEFLLSE